LLKVLKTGEDIGNEDPSQDQGENENKSDKYPIHDPSTDYKVKKPIVSNYPCYCLVLKKPILM